MPNSIKKFIKALFPAPIRERLLPIYHLFRAIVANIRYGFPAHTMTIVGVTGTNGKTTTTNMIGSVLTNAGYKVGILSSAVVQVAEEWQDSQNKLTTEDVFVLQKQLAQMRDAGVTHLVLEVSSHSIAQYRTWGIHFAGAVMTNISQDHLDYHHTMENYAATKLKLIKKAKDFVVLNADDEWFKFFNVRDKSTTVTYGQSRKAKYKIQDAKISASAASANIVASKQRIAAKLSLTGMFNLYNAAATVAVSKKLGLSDKQITAGLKALKSIPGRMEPIKEGQNFSVIVDHAHTEDALNNLLSNLKQVTKGKLITVLGADGERDPGKRIPLGRTAAEYSDFVFVTDQEPYGDDPQPIREQVLRGVSAGGYEEYEEIADRKKALKAAIKMAKRGDTVAVTGLGNQKYRGMNEGKIEWDERKILRNLLNK